MNKRDKNVIRNSMPRWQSTIIAIIYTMVAVYFLKK